MITINQNSDSDFKTIRTIAKVVWPVTYGKILSQEQLDYMFEMMYSIESLQKQSQIKKHNFIIAYEDLIPLGFASYEFNCENSNKTKVHKIYILPNLQGKGIGKTIINYISDEALKQNDKAVFLNVNRYNSAKYFYEKIGFSIVKEEDIDIGNGYLMEDYVMEKAI
ncbi:GNAT family N-acetyltransferase [Flavobacterium capsici]|uniref:GNAT family N-acetyltransferase n=1 Tax=Flavobacterium capsici TaxID=3075618 RepID=A0AA96EXP8_9FLAO|nr:MULTISPECIES: GNAT family N-acetyltransferase [unclassified Flavobacterium]WNM18820.1 GNAT family N-acetyltransferase [Flavobacterium sp. PMR2A8]WNM22871.1 GNAT family N-acetyltransferase [Flavobacterium sp. PMTSA4]